jgi:DNA-binding transcriptional LysR family regulator
VAAGVSRLNLRRARLPVELVSSIIARLPSTDPAAIALVRQLQSALQISHPVARYRPRITMKHIRSFLAARDHLNVTAAAKHLRIAQPALSSQLQKLEAIVGQPLFERRHDGLRPNPFTELLADLIRPQIARVDRIAASAAHYSAARRQRLAIGIMPMSNHAGALAAAIAGALDEWAGSHPSVRLKILEGPTEVLRRSVEAGEIGFALVEAQVSRSWQVDLDTEDQLGIVSNPERGILPPGETSLRAAAKLPLVLPSEAFGLRQILDKAAADIGVHLTPEMEVNSLTIMLALIGRMRLATILPESSVEQFVAEGKFQFNPIADPAAKRRLSILFSPDRNLTDIERALIGLLRRHLSRSGIGKIQRIRS